ncbi:MAG: ATP-binding protein [Anaerolineae bacterium]
MENERAVELHIAENVTELRRSSLKVAALLMFLAGYAGGVWAGWLSESSPPALVWGAISVMLIVPVACYLLWSQRLALAAHVLVWGFLCSMVGLFAAYPAPTTASLLVLPVVFAGLLLSQPMLFLVALSSSAAILVIGRLHAESSAEMTSAAIIILLVAAATWLSGRNLYTALSWVWTGYERARVHEQEARETQAELKRALKALDEAAYRLRSASRVAMLARDRAEEARRLKQQFAQTISHELRTPLNLIVGFTEVMIQSPEYYGGSLPPNYLRDLGIVYRNACHLQDLIADVLDLARIEAAQMSLVLEKVAPRELVCSVADTVRSLAESQGLYLRASVPSNSADIWVDPTRIRQVLFNLINNAIRFTETGGVTLSVEQRESDVLFAVSDTGVGIAPEDMDRIFGEFEQIDNSTRRQNQGVGLGLAISKRFITLHKGRMWAESEVGVGSTFYFTLPSAEMPHEPVQDEALLRSIEASRIESLEEPILLVVTRSPAAGTLLTRYIQGLRTVVTPDLEHAEQAVQQLLPQMVVIDQVSAPVDSERLVDMAQKWGIPQTVMVACPLPGEESWRRRLAVDGYLIKPVTHQSLWDVMRQFGEEIDRVLVVDDDRDFVLLISRLLEDNPVRNYRVASANTGQEALALLEYYEPDLILLDMILPDIDGAEVARQIQADDRLKEIPIVFVSAQDAMAYQDTMPGTMNVARSEGLTSGEVVKWIQALAESAVLIKPALEAQKAEPAR